MKKPQLVWDLKPVSYILGKDATALSIKKLNEFNQRFILVDENTKEHCLPIFNSLTNNIHIDGIITIKAGFNNKNISQTIDVWNQLTDLGAERDALIINLGGGVISDLGGFAASTYKRGLNFMNYPTSLLGMIDASIGGKTGLDFANVKNQIGLFSNPLSVVIDPIFLKTLDLKQLQSGYAEMLKCALIMDTDLWETISNTNFNQISDWDSLIVQAARNKVNIVRSGLQEKSIRKILNFGHTVGHAIESYYLNNDYDISHGEAVAAGIICETYISSKLFEFECTQIEEIISVIDLNFERFDLKIEDISSLMKFIKQDKMRKGGKYNFSLLRKLGKAVHDIEIDEILIKDSLEFYINGKTCNK